MRVSATWEEALEVYQPGMRGSCGEASLKARDETGIRFLLIPDLEGILKRRWEIVALGLSALFYNPSCAWRVT